MHFDNPIFILLLVVAGLFRWLAQRAEEKRKNAEPRIELPEIRREAARPAADDTEEERVRRFMEALGRPTGAAPPPKVVPRNLARPRPAVILPPLIPKVPPPETAPSSTEKPIAVLPPAAPAFAKPMRVREREAALFEVAHVQPAPLRPSAPGAPAPGLTSSRGALPESTVERLASPRALREAIILREIFGPPRSLQSIQGMGEA